MSAPNCSKTFLVDPARLSSGRWCHERDRQIGEGDIAASYSADKIALEGRVRSPFKWQKVLWVSVGSAWPHDKQGVQAYRLLPTRFFDGTPISYHENTMLGDEARTRPEGFYHGMSVHYGKQPHVLVGPKAIFLPSKEAEEPKQIDLLDLL
ncbi:hypothetical protein [Ruegeria profundi]|uniref:Uncharacterized protein n=1 Tax=Ruegeria profundi TaxID=1685378 RepID=A0A0X3TVA9_9RHOB|nr:hypothetical protein [Ruegeria profundi]KUJ77240.1 hypothetical protein AVO44_17805 [Ruegeria profundi]